jgi:hypothetical protein
MLLTRAELERIRSGEQRLVFRRWRRPTVKSGGTLKTAIGVLAIERIAAIERTQISKRDAAAAGWMSLGALLDELDARAGVIYRIELRYAGADPRLRLRDDDALDAAQLAFLRSKLERLDAASRRGPWTRAVLRAIERSPHQAASSLAQRTGFERDWLKRNVRKLKNLGLTISHHPGYELSKRGRALWKQLEREPRAASARGKRRD